MKMFGRPDLYQRSAGWKLLHASSGRLGRGWAHSGCGGMQIGAAWLSRLEVAMAIRQISVPKSRFLAAMAGILLVQLMLFSFIGWGMPIIF